MKTYLFRPLAVLSCFPASCSSDSPEDNELDGTPCSGITLPFRYSIILKDKDGHVMSGGNPSGGNSLSLSAVYWEEDIRLTPYPGNSYAEPVFSLRQYEQEYRIAVRTEFNECRQEGYLAMILELVEVRYMHFPNNHLYHKYTYDTIRFDLKALNDFVICENISVNGILLWENDGNREEEPCITLVKNRHSIVFEKPFTTNTNNPL
jgi:hypothetical protein